MNTINIAKNKHLKVWSPNSPFGKEHSVFPMSEATSLCVRGKARLVQQADALASMRKRIDPPAQWIESWIRGQFIKMGMPRKGVAPLVLVFQGEFSEAIVRLANERFDESVELHSYNMMVEAGRNPRGYDDGRVGHARWSGRPSLKSKVAGGPAMSTQQCTIVFRKEKP